ncbi:hypothetical protein KAR91_62160 [Candidatus Pacearchaeota archaeon]|nr:hypothetical protein [Candidatus Pacearchaeota archaeon]
MLKLDKLQIGSILKQYESGKRAFKIDHPITAEPMMITLDDLLVSKSDLDKFIKLKKEEKENGNN